MRDPAPLAHEAMVVLGIRVISAISRWDMPAVERARRVYHISTEVELMIGYFFLFGSCFSLKVERSFAHLSRSPWMGWMPGAALLFRRAL